MNAGAPCWISFIAVLLPQTQPVKRTISRPDRGKSTVEEKVSTRSRKFIPRTVKKSSGPAAKAEGSPKIKTEKVARIVAFFLGCLKLSTVYAVKTSRKETEEVKAAKASKRKKTLVHKDPNGRVLKTAGIVTKISPGPVSNSRLKAKRAGITIAPARIATKTSEILIINEFEGIFVSLAR